MTKSEIEKTIQEIWSHVDYAVGDWVETCAWMPGIVQSIEIGYDEKQHYFYDTVKIFYPHYALNPKYYPYKGGSCCSVTSCGVHKITPEYACKLMTIGDEKLSRLWQKKQEDTPWEKVVEEYYNKL